MMCRVAPVVPITVRPGLDGSAHSDFGQLLDSDGTVFALPSRMGRREPSVVDESRGWDPGNGLLCFFRVDELQCSTAKSTRSRSAARRRASREPQHSDERVFHCLIRMDITSRSARFPGRNGQQSRNSGLTNACSRRRRTSASASRRPKVRAFAAEALMSGRDSKL